MHVALPLQEFGRPRIYHTVHSERPALLHQRNEILVVVDLESHSDQRNEEQKGTVRGEGEVDDQRQARRFVLPVDVDQVEERRDEEREHGTKKISDHSVGLVNFVNGILDFLVAVLAVDDDRQSEQEQLDHRTNYTNHTIRSGTCLRHELHRELIASVQDEPSDQLI
jgi:hypothetical protein